MFIEVVQVFVKFALETGFGCGQPTFWVWLSAGQPVVNPLFRTLSTMFEINVILRFQKGGGSSWGPKDLLPTPNGRVGYFAYFRIGVCRGRLKSQNHFYLANSQKY